MIPVVTSWTGSGAPEGLYGCIVVKIGTVSFEYVRRDSTTRVSEPRPDGARRDLTLLRTLTLAHNEIRALSAVAGFGILTGHTLDALEVEIAKAAA